ncbi:gamma-glutamyltransferase, partial [Pseudomonadales bacterium]|nr:gamma-glutamyltransferase [Pseudomonadales bacterium]
MKSQKTSYCVFTFVIACFLSACSDSNSTRQAAIAVSDQYAANVAEEILLAGGNAVDAAVATGFALAVTYIDAGNIGGGGFMLIHMDGNAYFLDYRETAPMKAHRDMFLDENGNVAKNSTLIGPRAAGVPGTVAGFWAAHQKFGKLSWKQVLAPAIKLARDGFIPANKLAREVQSHFDWFGTSTNFKEHFSKLKAGERFKQPALAATLTRIAKNGHDEFYTGETSKLIVNQMERDG